MANWLSRWIDRITGLDTVVGDIRTVDPTPTETSDPGQWPNWPAGSKLHSLRVPRAKLYRYQSKEFLELGDTWYHMVWDIDYKWRAANRFSGKDISSGHFFSVNPDGARAEMRAYELDLDEYELLEFTLSIDNLLDLTDIDALIWFYKKHFAPDRDWHWGVMLDSLFAQQKGGDAHNDFAGHKALLDGYNGIVFFGARAVESFWTDPGSMMNRDWDLISYYHEAMRAEEACINVVIYFGHNVVQSTHEISFKDNKIINPLFSASFARLDEIFAADPAKAPDIDLSYDDLLSRVEDIAWVSKPGITEERSHAAPKKPGT